MVGFELGTNVGSELGFLGGKVIGTILGAVDRLPIRIYNGRVIGSLEGFIDGAVDGKCLCFFLNRVCSHIRMEILKTGLYVYVCVGVEGIYT